MFICEFISNLLLFSFAPGLEHWNKVANLAWKHRGGAIRWIKFHWSKGIWSTWVYKCLYILILSKHKGSVQKSTRYVINGGDIFIYMWLIRWKEEDSRCRMFLCHLCLIFDVHFNMGTTLKHLNGNITCFTFLLYVT